MNRTRLKAIETVYNGYRFRSRLEARWAVFFDSLGISYEYEKEGYDLNGLWYLPDFWLPRQQYWIEIKPEKPTDEEDEKAFRLAEASGCSVYVFFGNIELPRFDGHQSDNAHIYYTWRSWNCDAKSPDCTYAGCEDPSREKCGYCEQEERAWDNNHLWCECIGCGSLGITFEGLGSRIPCGCDKTKTEYNSYDTPRLIQAYLAARQARFEHHHARSL